MGQQPGQAGVQVGPGGHVNQQFAQQQQAGWYKQQQLLAIQRQQQQQQQQQQLGGQPGAQPGQFQQPPAPPYQQQRLPAIRQHAAMYNTGAGGAAGAGGAGFGDQSYVQVNYISKVRNYSLLKVCIVFITKMCIFFVSGPKTNTTPCSLASGCYGSPSCGNHLSPTTTAAINARR